jgi:galactosylgalactosylxylosylprotein 3-beta-glucuronosyltransferase 3
LTVYEEQEKTIQLKQRFKSLYSYFNKFKNLSYPISYSLGFYESYYEMPRIFIITPTNNDKPTQLADLTRLRNTLWIVPKILWIVIEDSESKTDKISKLLHDSKIPFVHLNTRTPADFKVKKNEKDWTKPRGVLQRNKGIDWLRDHQDRLNEPGVVYFADDDNTYDIRLFEEVNKHHFNP